MMGVTLVAPTSSVIHTNGERAQIMVQRKPGSGLFSRRTASSLFGDSGQSNSIFGKARISGEYTGNTWKSASRKSGQPAHSLGKQDKPKRGKNSKDRRQANKVGK